MTDGNLTVKTGFVTWAMWVIAGVLILADTVMAWSRHGMPATSVGPLGNLGIFIAALAATWTVCACVHAAARQVLAQLVRLRRDNSERDSLHALP